MTALTKERNRVNEDTTTEQDVQPVVGADEAQPVNADVSDTAGDSGTSEPSEPSQGGDEAEEPTTQPQVDDKLQKYARSQGLELDSPSAIKAAQIAMKAQSEATRNGLKASELEKATNITQEQLPDDAPQSTVDAARIRNMELRMEVQSWKMANQDKLGLEKEMISILADPNKKLLVQEGYLSLDDLYKLAKADSPDNSEALKAEGGRERLQSLAHKQQAQVPAGHATTQSTPKEKPFNELSIQEMESKLGKVRY